MRKRKKITPDLIEKLKVVLVKIDQVKSAPKQLKPFVKKILYELDTMAKDENSQKRLLSLGLLAELVNKLLQMFQLLK